MNQPRRPRVTVVCGECKTEFSRCPSQITTAKVYCSRKCLGLANRHGSSLFCQLCDGEFYRRFGEQDVGIKVNQFCSQSCLSEWRALRRSPGTYLKTGYRHTHRVVAETVLCRPLSDGEVVHHIDHDKQNNDPTNLAVFPSQSHHMRCHKGTMSDEELRGFSLVQAPRRETVGV